MRKRKKLATLVIAIPLLIAGCGPKQHAYEAPTGEVLALEVLSAERVGSETAKVSVCFGLPSEADWVLGRLLGDVTLSNPQASAAMDHFELLALSDSPPRRCDRLFFSRPGGFPPGDYTLTIQRLAASLPPNTDWVALQMALDEAATGIAIAPLPGEGGFALLQRPNDMTDSEASLVVTGLQEPVVLGPWIVPLSIEE